MDTLYPRYFGGEMRARPRPIKNRIPGTRPCCSGDPVSGLVAPHRVPFIVREADEFARREGAGADQQAHQGRACRPKKRGVKLGGWTAGSERSQREAEKLANQMKPVMEELAALSAHKAAAELNRR